MGKASLANMPHVVSQLSGEMHSRELFLESPTRRRAVAMSKRVVEKQHPSIALARQRRNTSNMDKSPSLSIRIGLPEDPNQDIEYIRHIREPPSATESNTPDSSNDSVFDMYPPEEPLESPASSVYQPSHAAELEDTSRFMAAKKATKIEQPFVQSFPASKKPSRMTYDPYVAPLSVNKKSPHVAEKSYFEQLSRPQFAVGSSSAAIRNLELTNVTS